MYGIFKWFWFMRAFVSRNFEVFTMHLENFLPQNGLWMIYYYDKLFSGLKQKGRKVTNEVVLFDLDASRMLGRVVASILTGLSRNDYCMCPLIKWCMTVPEF